MRPKLARAGEEAGTERMEAYSTEGPLPSIITHSLTLDYSVGYETDVSHTEPN